MKRINLRSVEQVVAVIDYSKFVTFRNGKIFMSQDILNLVKNAISLPSYDKANVDIVKKTITLVVYIDQIEIF